MITTFLPSCNYVQSWQHSQLLNLSFHSFLESYPARLKFLNDRVTASRSLQTVITREWLEHYCRKFILKTSPPSTLCQLISCSWRPLIVEYIGRAISIERVLWPLVERTTERKHGLKKKLRSFIFPWAVRRRRCWRLDDSVLGESFGRRRNYLIQESVRVIKIGYIRILAL